MTCSPNDIDHFPIKRFSDATFLQLATMSGLCTVTALLSAQTSAGPGVPTRCSDLRGRQLRKIALKTRQMAIEGVCMPDMLTTTTNTVSHHPPPCSSYCYPLTYSAKGALPFFQAMRTSTGGRLPHAAFHSMHILGSML